MPNPSTRSLSRLAWPLFLAGLIVYLVSFRVQVERNPLRADEVDFYRCTRNVISLGRPLYYAGEVTLPVAHVVPLGAATLDGQAFQFYRFKPETGILKETFFGITDGDSRYTYCLWHPPLYVYLGSLALRLVEIPDAQANLFRYSHLVYVALMLLGIAALMRELYRPVWFLGLALATLFLACSSLAVRASVLVDYNGALAMSAAVWVAWAFLRASRESRYFPLAAAGLALSFLVGLGVGTSLALGLLLWSLLFRRAGAAQRRHRGLSRHYYISRRLLCVRARRSFSVHPTVPAQLPARRGPDPGNIQARGNHPLHLVVRQ